MTGRGLQAILGIAVALLTIGGAVGKYWIDTTSAAIENDRLHREVHQLKRVIVSEFPAYTAAMDWDDR